VALVPPVFVTVTSTVPAVSAGEVAVICVSVSTVNVVAGDAPKSTLVALVKPVPVMVTDVPPESGPDAGLIDVTVGAATNVNRSLAFVALVPPADDTFTSTVPAACATEFTVI